MKKPDTTVSLIVKKIVYGHQELLVLYTTGMYEVVICTICHLKLCSAPGAFVCLFVLFFDFAFWFCFVFVFYKGRNMY